jgi:hypothetical protein
MSEKQENFFKFKVYQGNNVLFENIFTADSFNPAIRYSVNIRELIPTYISMLQKTLSKRNLNFVINVGKGKTYNLLKEYRSRITPKINKDENKLTHPNVITQTILGKTIRGVECKFGLYINNKPIVERVFYVDNYNPAIRFSVDLKECIDNIVEDIINNLIKLDIKHMWDDYDLINTYGLYIQQIRDLELGERDELILNKHKVSFVKRIKDKYRTY